MIKKVKWSRVEDKVFKWFFMGGEVATIFRGQEWVLLFKNSDVLHKFGDDLEQAKKFGEDLIIREMAFFLTGFFQELNNVKI